MKINVLVDGLLGFFCFILVLVFIEVPLLVGLFQVPDIGILIIAFATFVVITGGFMVAGSFRERRRAKF